MKVENWVKVFVQVLLSLAKGLARISAFCDALKKNLNN